MTDQFISESARILPIVISGASAMTLALLVFFLVKKVINSSKSKQVASLNGIRNPFVLVCFFMAVRISTTVYFGSVNELWARFVQITFIILLAWLVIAIVAIGRELLERQYHFDKLDNLKARKIHTQIKVFERIIVVIIIITAVSLSLMTFDTVRNIGASILASAGITGIIVGFAAQKLIGNLLAGFQIAITQPIRIDDVVIVENEWGNIEEITLTYVVIKIWDQRRLVVPSTYFIEKPFQNWTRKNSELLGTVFIFLDYTFPVDVLRTKITAILNDTNLWDGRVNVLQVTNFSEKTMELRALMSAKDSPTAWDLRVHVREQIIDFLQSNYPDSLPKARIMLDKTAEL